MSSIAALSSKQKKRWVYDALNSIDKTYEPYVQNLSPAAAG